MRTQKLLVAAAILILSGRVDSAEDRPGRVRKDREQFLASGRWIYNDLPKAFEEARKSGKPLVVTIRCIPCESCRGFDEELTAGDPRIEALLDRFVRVRIPQANGLDLSLFQFDYDLSFYAFFLNADRTIYGRFGSPSTQKDKTGKVSMDAFREALVAALELHGRHGELKERLKAKTGPVPALKVPEEYPPLKGKYTAKIDYENAPVKSCIHCHQIRDSEREMVRSAKKPIPDSVLYPWPLPDVFGLHLDPHKAASIERVDKGSVAEKAGFRAGDALLELEGQPLVSIADVQWVLERSPEVGTLQAKVRREGEAATLKLPLKAGWRRGSDISWRATTWELRRRAAGGLLLEDLPAADRREAGLAENVLALRAKHVGEYGEHAVAKKAGFRKGDIIVAVDGRSERQSESGLIGYALQKKRPGDRLAFSVLREGKRLEMSFSVQ